MTMEKNGGNSSRGGQVGGKSVCVYCGSSFGAKALYSESAEELGALFHKLGWKLVYGGGTTGSVSYTHLDVYKRQGQYCAVRVNLLQYPL